MSTSERIAELRVQRSELHNRGDVARAIPLQREILSLLEAGSGSAKDLANAHNYLSVLYTKSQDFPLAEAHARRAIDLHPRGDTPSADDALACYSMMLARILMLLGRQPEALPYAETALREWAIVHNPPNDFLRARLEELVAMRAGAWKNCFTS
jgi:tetratricopeptide (TPR) repeat protein